MQDLLNHGQDLSFYREEAGSPGGCRQRMGGI